MGKLRETSLITFAVSSGISGPELESAAAWFNISIYTSIYIRWIDRQIKRNIIDYLCRELGNLRP